MDARERDHMASAVKMTTDFSEKEVVLRGVTYRLRELSIGDYDDLVRKATDVRKDALGEDVESVDNSRLLRLMVVKCLIEPKLSADKFVDLPSRVVFKLNALVNQMHYGDEPESNAPAPEGDTTGNAD